MVVIAILHLDVDARISQAARKFTELAWFTLIETHYKHRPSCEDAEAGILERSTCGRAICEQEVSEPLAIGEEHAATFDAHPSPAKRLTHRCQCAGMVVEFDREILPRAHSLISSICSTEMEREPPRS